MDQVTDYTLEENWQGLECQKVRNYGMLTFRLFNSLTIIPTHPM